jgi:nucleotide-binding universal stress UspA family protein
VLGSTSAEIVGHAVTPVVVARTPSVSGVVLADDGSAEADAAARALVALGAFASFPTCVVTVAEDADPITGFPRHVQGDDQQRPAQEWADARAARLREAGWADVTAIAAHGDPADEIVRIATERGADLIVMGTHGRTGLRRLLAGSVAWTVLHRAAASVLVARTPGGP